MDSLHNGSLMKKVFPCHKVITILYFPAHSWAQLPLTREPSYHSPMSPTTTHSWTELPLTRKPSYHSPVSSATTHPWAQLPLTPEPSYHSLVSPATTHPWAQLPLTHEPSYHSPVSHAMSVSTAVAVSGQWSSLRTTFIRRPLHSSQRNSG